jgi:hypothetical protein
MLEIFVFHSKKVGEGEGREYTWCWSIKIGKRIPSFIPLLIPSFADYHSIVKLMNVS